MTSQTRLRRQALLRAAKRYIAVHYIDVNLDLGTVAADVGTSRRQLQRVFSEEAGLAFRDYLLAVRVRRAVQLLERGWSSERVAHAVGYSGRSGLRLALRRHLGKTASDFQPEGPDYDVFWRERERRASGG